MSSTAVLEGKHQKTEGSSTLEWGPDFGYGSWYQAMERLEELNKHLSSSQEPWRMPKVRDLKNAYHAKKIRAGFRREPYWTGVDGNNDKVAIAVHFGRTAQRVERAKEYPAARVRFVR